VSRPILAKADRQRQRSAFEWCFMDFVICFHFACSAVAGAGVLTRRADPLAVLGR
jgi:hypothetical protein